jgi:hypothetical protein
MYRFTKADVKLLLPGRISGDVQHMRRFPL